MPRVHHVHPVPAALEEAKSALGISPIWSNLTIYFVLAPGLAYVAVFVGRVGHFRKELVSAKAHLAPEGGA